jgi:predicted membrane protein DUF2243
VATGALLARRAGASRRPERRAVTGGLLLGFGGFNLIEGIVDHLALGIHHVREGGDAMAYDLGFLAVAAAITVAGALLTGRVVATRAGDEGRDAGSHGLRQNRGKRAGIPGFRVSRPEVPGHDDGKHVSAPGASR